MAELARLRIAVDSTSAKTAERDLEGLASAAGNTGRAVDAMIASQKRMTDAMQSAHKPTLDAVRYLDSLNRELETIGKSSLQIKAMEIKMAAAAAPTAELAREIREVGAALIKAERDAEAMAVAQAQLSAATRSTEATINNLESALMRVGKSSSEIRRLEIEMAAAKAPTEALANKIRTLGIELENAERAAMTSTPHITSMGNSSKLAGHHAQNLAFQLQDVGVSLVSGQNPLMVFAQQGTQIAGIMGQAGLSVRGLAVEIAGMTGRVVAAVALNPAFLAFAAAAGTAFVAFKDFQAQVGKTGELEKFQRSLGLTKKELKELEKEVGPAAITMGDVFKGLGKTISDALNLDKAFDMFKKGFFATFRFVADLASDVAAGIYAAFVGGFRGIVEVFKNLPNVLGDLTIRAVNNVSRAIEVFLNGFIASTNTLLRKLGMETIKTIVDIPELENKYAGAANAAGKAFTGQIKQAFGEAKDGFRAAGDTLSANIIDAAKQRMQGGADTILDERTLKAAAKKAGQTLGEYIAIETGQAITALEKSFRFDDSVFKDASKRLQELADIGSNARAEAARQAEEDTRKSLKTFSDVIGGVADVFGGKMGATINRLGNLFERDFPEFSKSLGAVFDSIGESIDGVLAQIGTSMGQLGASLRVGLELGNALGSNRSEKRGAAIGSTVYGTVGGAVGGPAGAAIGSIIGALHGMLIGGLFHRNPYADVQLTGQGPGNVFASRGKDSAEFGGLLGQAFSEQLGTIAAGLGGTVRGGTGFGHIGFSGEEFYFNAMGGDFRSGGAQKFASAEEAIAAAIKAAVSQGAFEGLSESSKIIVEKLAGLGTEEIMKVLEQISTARNALADAYNREAAAIGATIEKFQAMTANLQAFRETLAQQLMTAEEIYTAARSKFEEISAAAISGNEEAISQLVGVSQNYLDSAKNFLTPEEYNREIENVMRAVDLAIEQSKSLEAYAQEQLAALNASVDGLITLDKSVLSVADAIKNLQDVMKNINTRPINITVTGGTAFTTDGGGEMPGFSNGGMHSGGYRIVGENGPEIEATGSSRIYNANQTAAMLGGGLATAQEVAALRVEMKAALYAVAKNTSKTADQLVRWDGDGLPDARGF